MEQRAAAVLRVPQAESQDPNEMASWLQHGEE